MAILILILIPVSDDRFGLLNVVYQFVHELFSDIWSSRDSMIPTRQG